MKNTLHMIKIIPILFSRKYANATGQCIINNVNLIWHINSDNWPLIGNVWFHDAFMWRKMIKKRNTTPSEQFGNLPENHRNRGQSDTLTHIYMTPNTHIHDCPISYLGTCISINSGGVKLVLYAQTSTLSQTARTCMSSTCE